MDEDCVWWTEAACGQLDHQVKFLLPERLKFQPPNIEGNKRVGSQNKPSPCVFSRPFLVFLLLRSAVSPRTKAQSSLTEMGNLIMSKYFSPNTL